MKLFLFILIAAAGALFFTNPDEAKFREHVKQKAGLVGTAGMAALDAVTGGKDGAIKRDNFFVASKFYMGGDGVIPRVELGWGVAGMIIEADKKKP